MRNIHLGTWGMRNDAADDDVDDGEVRGKDWVGEGEPW